MASRTAYAETSGRARRVGLFFVSACGLVVSCGASAGSPPRYVVGGTADGLEETTATLLLNGANPIEIPDGPFSFPAVVADGERYEVTLPAAPARHRCSLERSTGTIEGRPVGDVAVHCPSADASLADLSLSGALLSPAFDPAIFEYSAGPFSVPLFSMTTTVVTARPTHPKARVVITPSSPVSLAPGETKIDVAVTALDGTESHYLVEATSRATYDYLKASNTRAMTTFGWSVALSGDTLAVGSPYESSSAQGLNGDQSDATAAYAGAVYVFRRVGTTWAQEAYVKASNTRSGAHFGESVALSGDTLVVGSVYESSAANGIDGNQADTSAYNAGAVYVFQRSGSTWAQQAYVKASNTRSSAYFGASVALSGDTLVVGSERETSNATGINGNQGDTSADDAGAVYVFQRTGSTWAQQAYVKASNTRSSAYFGASVALTGDTLAVGSVYESSAATGIDGNQADTSAISAGAVYVFQRTGTTWTQQAYVKASNARADAFFGHSVVLSDDTLAVGSDHESSGATGVGGNQSDTTAREAGAVYVFRRTGATWAQEGYLKASNTHTGAHFGSALALSADTLIVGATGEASGTGAQTDTSAPGAGAVYVFQRAGTTWTQGAYLKPDVAHFGARFGGAAALSGSTLAVGSDGEWSSATGINGNQSDTTEQSAGATYVF